MNKEQEKPKIFCDECEGEIEINKNTLADERIEMHKLDKEAVLRLTYLQCPHCGRVYPIMLDDKRTLYYLGKAQKSRGGSGAAKAVQQLKNTRQELASKWINGVYTLAGRVYVFEGLCKKDIEQN